MRDPRRGGRSFGRSSTARAAEPAVCRARLDRLWGVVHGALCVRSRFCTGVAGSDRSATAIGPSVGAHVHLRRPGCLPRVCREIVSRVATPARLVRTEPGPRAAAAALPVSRGLQAVVVSPPASASSDSMTPFDGSGWGAPSPALCCTISARIRLVRSPLRRPGLEVLEADGLVPGGERLRSSGPAVAAAAGGRASGTPASGRQCGSSGITLKTEERRELGKEEHGCGGATGEDEGLMLGLLRAGLPPATVPPGCCTGTSEDALGRRGEPRGGTPPSSRKVARWCLSERLVMKPGGSDFAARAPAPPEGATLAPKAGDSVRASEEMSCVAEGECNGSEATECAKRSSSRSSMSSEM